MNVEELDWRKLFSPVKAEMRTQACLHSLLLMANFSLANRYAPHLSMTLKTITSQN